jgi:hypothetical protein
MALKWLNKTIKSAGIQESTRQQLVKRRKLWQDVIEAYKGGDDALAAGQFKVAAKRFQWIIQNLATTENVYRRLSEAKLEEINKEKNLGPDQLFKRARECLLGGQYAVAHRLLQRARKANNGSQAFEKKVIVAVDAVEKKFKVLLAARKIVLGNRRKEFDTALSIAALLKDFLPAGDRRQKRASELYQKLLKK